MKIKDFKNIITKNHPEKRLLLSMKAQGGRNNTGRITTRHQGGGVKRLYRIIDFGQSKLNVPAKVLAFEYDPNRTPFIMLLEYQDGERRYALAPQGLKVGDQIISSENTEFLPGNRMKIKNIPIGTMIYNLEIEPGRGGKLVRGAGVGAKVLAQVDKYTHVEMPSGETRQILGECFASVGMLSNAEKKYMIVGKAGRNRLRGIRPSVRGSAMNPVDHPHGGGEGRTPIGLKYPKTPWGKHASGVKTRGKKWTDKFIIKRRQKKH